MTTYRQLSADELIQLGQELENYQRWERVREYATMLYPPEAYQLTISVTSEYNDNTYDDDVHVIVTDREGTPLPFDFSLPWWRRFLLSAEDMERISADKSGSLTNVADNISGVSGDEIKTLCTDLLGVEFLETWQPRDPLSYTYIIDAPPAISHATVYVAE